MKKSTLRFTSLFLICLILLTSCAFVSCADTGSEGEVTTVLPAATQNTPDTAEVTEDGAVKINDYALCAVSLVALPADFAAKVESRNALTLERNRQSEKTESNNNLLLI